VRSLLADAAQQMPLVCFIDDAQWLDELSVRTLAFAARRLDGLPVALVFGMRDVSDELAGLPDVEIAGLSQLEARTLVEKLIPGPLDEEVRSRIAAETEGNPLAIANLLRQLSLATVISEFGPPSAVALPETLEASFRRRLEQLPADTRLFLLVASAEPLGRPSVLWRAADILGLAPGAARRAEADGLLRLGASVRFSHPLLRSAVYRAASRSARRRVHSALAEATNPRTDPDQRTWHRGHAASVHDEELAAEMEQAAVRARTWAPVAALLEQAAALTPDPARRSERTLAAAQAKLAAGALDEALELLPRVEARLLDERQAGRLERLWAEVVVAQGGTTNAPALVVRAAKRLESVDAQLARETYLRAIEVAREAGRFDSDPVVLEAADAVRTGPASPQPPQGLDLLLDGLTTLVNEGHAGAFPTLKRALRSLDEESNSEWLSLRAATAMDLWDDATARALAERQKDLSLRTGAPRDLQRSLVALARLSVLAGDFAGAADSIEQASLIAPASTADHSCVPLMMAAFRGQEAETSALIESTTRRATLRGEGSVVAFTEAMTALLHNGLGHYRKAFVSARRAASCLEPGVSGWALAELVEAAARCGERHEGDAALQRLSERTKLSGTDWALGLEAYAQALMSEGNAADELFKTAIELLSRCSITTWLARAHLVYGEWLRRDSRRVEAREQLRTAVEMFTAMGAEAFAERAERELLATGARLQKRGAEVSTQLTPQEAQISQLARDGHSTPEIAAKFYISPRTVEYHLRKVFRKLGISSRNELRRVLPA
jgi:DNA-binding CsgD family transcriptional regulator